MKRIIQKKKKLIFVLTIIFLTVLMPILLIKMVNKKTDNLILKNAPVKSNYLYQNISKGFAVYLGNRSNEKSTKVKFSAHNSSIEFALANSDALNNNQVKFEKKDEKSIIYKNIYPGIDLVYTLAETGVKEEIVIDNQSAAISNEQFIFNLNLQKAIPRKDPMGNLTSTFVDPESGEYLFHFAKPFMIDAGGNQSQTVNLKIISQNYLTNNSQPTTYQVILQPDQNWLKTALYPVIIDPTVIHDEASEFSGTYNRTDISEVGGLSKTWTTTSDFNTSGTSFSAGMLNPATNDELKLGDGSGYSADKCTGGTASAIHSYDIYVASRAFDANDTTQWRSGGCGPSSCAAPPYWLKYDFGVGVTHKIRKIRILQQVGFEINSHQLEGSNNDSTWTQIGDTWTNASKTLDISHEFSNDTAYRYYRLYINTTHRIPPWYQASIFSLEMMTIDYASGEQTWTSEAQDAGVGNTYQPRSLTASWALDGSDNLAPKFQILGSSTGAFGGEETIYPDGTGTYYQDGGTYDINSGVALDVSSEVTSAFRYWKVKAYMNTSTTTTDTPKIYDIALNENLPSIELYEQELSADIHTVGLWHMDESSGTTVTDSSGLGNNGTATNTEDGDWTTAKFDNGLNLDGSNEYVNRAYDADFDFATNSFTVEGWFKHNTISAADYLVARYDTDQGFKIWMDGDGDLYFGIDDDATWGPDNQAYSTDANYDDNAWHHFAAVKDGTTFIKLYVDGTEIMSTAVTATATLTSNSAVLRFGSDAPTAGSYWEGMIDEFRISNIARTAEEIKLDAQYRPYGVYTSQSIDLGTSVSSLDSLEWTETTPSNTDLEFQTRTSADNSTWEDWKPTANETAITAMDSDASNWSWDSTATYMPQSKTDESTIKTEGSGSLKEIIGAPQDDANVVGLWHMDETSGTGAYIKDYSGNNNHTTPTDTTLVEGFYGKARSFNGTSSVITRASVTTYNASRTVEFWFYPKTTGAQRGIISVGNVWNDTGPAWLITQRATNVLSVYHGANYRDGTTAITPNVWHHGAYTFNSSGNAVALYLDGKLEYSGTVADYNGNNTNLYLGAGYPAYFSGYLDEVRISNTARTAEEVAEAYRAGRDHRLERTLSSTDLSSKTKVPFYVAADRPGTYLETYVGETSHSIYGTDANTAGLWHLDEQSGSGAYLKDLSGNSNHGTPTNATYTQGKIGAARNFNGASAFIGCGTGATLEFTNAITLEAWIKTTTTAASSTAVIQKMQLGSPYNGKVLGIYGDYVFFHAGGTYASNALYGNIDVTDGQWHHIVGGYDGTNSFIYVDGQLDESAARTNNLGAVGEALEIGRDYSGTIWFNGLIDEVRISNVARTSTEILQAYQYGLRTHQITVDYSTMAGSDGPTSTSDYEFTPDSVSGLYTGDTVIVRENVDGTTYIMQGEVTSISSGLVTVSSWSGTAPSGGYSTNADVFKWQKEYWDITDISSDDRDAITKLGIRVLDGSEGFDMYVDDFRNNSIYMTNPAGSDIDSTVQRYFQYRAILTTTDTTVSPAFSSVTLNYTENETPTAPTSLLTEGQTNPSQVTDTEPEFSAIYNDPDSDDIANKYRIQVDDDSEFGSPIWDSGISGTSMTDCNQGDRCSDISYLGTTLTGGTTYYWRIKYWDDDGAEGAWSTEGAYFSVNYTPLAPTSLLTESQTNPSGIVDTTPEFSAFYNDSDSGDIANKYRIQVDDDSAFGSALWDSGESGTAMSDCNEGDRCSDISYGGASSDLQWDTKYYWRIKYWDDGGAEGAWSTEEAYFTMMLIYPPTSCLIDDSSHPEETLIKWADNTSLETGYRIERSVDGAEWTLFSTEAIGTTSKVDNTTETNTVYKYRVRADSDNGNSTWCTTSNVNYGRGTIYFK